MEKDEAKTVHDSAIRHLDPEIPLDHFLMRIWKAPTFNE